MGVLTVRSRVALRTIAATAALVIATSVPVRAACTDSDGDSYYAESGCGTAVDCNDRAPAVHPGAIEACNGFDDNCDANVDEGCLTSCGNPAQLGPIVEVDVPPAADESPVLAWTGFQYGVAWVQYVSSAPPAVRSVRLARLDAGGSLLGQTQVSDSGTIENQSIVWTGSEYGIAWHENSEVFFQRTGPDGTNIGVNIQVSDADPARSDNPAIAWTGHEYGIAWYDERGGAKQIYFARLDSSGNKIGGDLPVGDPSAVAGNSTVAWNGNEYGVV